MTNLALYSDGSLSALFLVLVIWSLVWKGLALWKAARLGAKPWFIVMLVLNTVGVLEILYIFVFSRGKKEIVSSVSLENKKEIRELLEKASLSKEDSEKLDRAVEGMVDNLNKNVLKEIEE